MYYSLRKYPTLFCFQKPGGYQWSALIWSDLEPSEACQERQLMASSIWARQCLVLSSDFHYKENDRTSGAAHLIQTFLTKLQTPGVCQAPYSPDIRRYCHTIWMKCPASVVPSLYLQWKSDESTKQYLTQILPVINWRYWKGEKIHLCILRSKVASSNFASLKSTRFCETKIRPDTSLTE